MGRTCTTCQHWRPETADHPWGWCEVWGQALTTTPTHTTCNAHEPKEGEGDGDDF